jgi:hypothetical protein
MVLVKGMASPVSWAVFISAWVTSRRWVSAGVDRDGGQAEDGFGGGGFGAVTRGRSFAEAGGVLGGLAHAELPGDGEGVDGGAGAGDRAQGLVDLAMGAGGEGAGWEPFQDLGALGGVLEQAGQDFDLASGL